jgi:hypothetical protein
MVAAVGVGRVSALERANRMVVSVAAMVRRAARAEAAAILGVERDQEVVLAKAVIRAGAGAPWARVMAVWMVAAGARVLAARRVATNAAAGSVVWP